MKIHEAEVHGLVGPQAKADAVLPQQTEEVLKPGAPARGVHPVGHAKFAAVDLVTGALGEGQRWRDDIGKEFAIHAEIDALVARLYDLTQEEFQHILSTFPLVDVATKSQTLNAYRDLLELGSFPRTTAPQF